MTAQFSTISLVRESAEVISRFIAYYRDLGAAEILLFHDGPTDHLAHLDLAGVALRECDDAFWQARGGRPEALEDRQSAVFMHGLEICRGDWMLVIDADEYVFGDRPVSAFLAGLPDRVASVRLPTAEAVWGPGDDLDAPFGSTCFRTAWRNARLWRLSRRLVYGDVSRYFRQGVAGHLSGKQFLRTDRRYSAIGNHHAEQDGADISVWAPALGPEGRGMYLGHFDAIGYDRWTRKWRGRITRETVVTRMAGPRTAQLGAIATALDKGETAARAMFGRLYALSPLQYGLLSALGYAFRRDIFQGSQLAPPQLPAA